MFEDSIATFADIKCPSQTRRSRFIIKYQFEWDMALFVNGFVTSGLVSQQRCKFAPNEANRCDIIRHQIPISTHSIRILYALFLYHALYVRAFYPNTIHSILVHSIPRYLSPARFHSRALTNHIYPQSDLSSSTSLHLLKQLLTP